MTAWSASERARFVDTLARDTATLGLELDASVFESLADYQALLAQWNRTHRLVGSADPQRSVEEHFLDSLAVLRVLPQTGEGVDIGSGAGFPGAVLAAADPARTWVLVEPLQKRVGFLNAVRAGLGLSHLRLSPVRSDALADSSVSLMVSRATLPPAELLTEAARLLTQRGAVVVMTARGLDAPTVQLAHALGLRIDLQDTWTLPSTGAPRTNTLVRRTE